MRLLVIFIFVSAVLIQCCCAQTKSERDFYSEQFKWSITIPEGFEKVPAEQWAKIQNKGKTAIEETFNETIDNVAKTIFIFKSNQYNYFESNYQPFDKNAGLSYKESCKAAADMIYQTFLTQMPNVTMDSTLSTSIIDELEFETVQVNVTYPNGVVLHVQTYSRLFGTKEFSVNIMYVDEAKGQAMIKAWSNSRFQKDY